MSARRWPFSHSQASEFRRCPRAYEFRYEKKIRFRAAWSVRGLAVHKAIQANYQHKLEHRDDLPRETLLGIVQEEIRQAFSPMAQADASLVLFEGETQESLLADARAQVATYRDTLAPGIMPMLIEEPLTTTLPSGLRLQGILDLVDEDGLIRDAKFPGNRMKLDQLYLEDQPPIYAALYREKIGHLPRQVIFDVVARGGAKEPKPSAESLALDITEGLVESRLADLESEAALVDMCHATGRYPRRASTQNCNKCVYAPMCWWTLKPVRPRTLGVPDPPAEPDLVPALEASLAQVQAAKAAAEPAFTLTP